MAVLGGILAGYWFSGWNFRGKNKKLKQKYERDIAVRAFSSFNWFERCRMESWEDGLRHMELFLPRTSFRFVSMFLRCHAKDSQFPLTSLPSSLRPSHTPIPATREAH